MLRDIRTTQRAPDWIADHSKLVLDLVHTAIADNHAETATELLVELWRLLPDDVGEEASRHLHESAVALAQALPTSLRLARAFRLGAGRLRTRGMYRLAAAQGMYELAIHRLRDDDPDAAASALLDLATTYRAQGRMHKVIGCADEALETYGLHRDTPGFARTLYHLGRIMIDIERYDSALTYLARAATAYGNLADTAALPLCRAVLSRAHRLRGEARAADRHLNRALALVVGTDDATAELVRGLAADTRQPADGMV
ncbi:hypothetical protein ACWEFJ_30835 [Actinosynnema sp. NPDC004786]